MSNDQPPTVSGILNRLKIIHHQSEILLHIQRKLESGSGGYYVALNAEKIVAAIRNPKILEVLMSADFLFMDGVGAKLSYKLLLHKNADIISGYELMLQTLQLSKHESLKVGLYGADEQTIIKTKEVLIQLNPNVNFVFARHGFLPNQREINRDIHSLMPNIVFVALGSPAQEEWIHENFRSFPSTLFTGVGGSFDVISGKTYRAPRLIRKLGLEWLFRFILQPLKRWKRMLTLVRFSFMVIRERVSK